MPRAIAALRAEFPGLQLSLVDDHMQGLLPRLRDRELDLALVFGDADRDDQTGLDDQFDVAPLFDDTYRLLLPRGHRLTATDRTLDLRDLADETWIGGGPNSSWFALVRAACRSSGFEPRVELVSDDYLAVQAFVAAGLGVSVVPGLVVTRRLSGVQVRELRPPVPRRRIAVAHPHSRFPPAATTAMVRILRETTRSRR